MSDIDTLNKRNEAFFLAKIETTPENVTAYLDLEAKCDELNIPLNSRQYHKQSISGHVFAKFMAGEL